MTVNVSTEIVMKKISEIKPYVRNPRRNDKTVELLTQIIPVVGFNVPLVIDKKGVIVKGHARYAAAIKLGMEEIPCVVTEADEETIRLDRLSDNKISEFSDWLDDELLHELDSINLDFDFEALGFPALQEETFFDAFDDDEDPEQESAAERQARFAAFLEQSAEVAQRQTQITDQAAIDQAKERAASVPALPSRYFKVVCEHCGHVMFIKEGDAVFAN